MRRPLLLLALALCLIASPWARASAQTLHLDPNGVDLFTSLFTFANPSISIGPKGPGGLTYSILDVTQPQKDAFFGTLQYNPQANGETYGVTLATGTDVLEWQGNGSILSQLGTGASLAASYNSAGRAIYTYTTKDGVQYIFDSSL
ncbi:MAG: hypothetical protein JOZ83_09260 [Silvibacterium sp.]|nr:hypothetical protein [Silvibacterium sp.]